MATFRMGGRIFVIMLLAGCFSLPAQGQTLPISLTRVLGGLAAPVHITHAGDGSGRLFIVEQAGQIRIVRNGLLQPAPFLNISDRVLSGGEQGLLSVAFPPGFAQKGYFYVNYTRNLNLDGATIVSRFFLTGNPDIADPASEQILLTIAQPFANHNGGQLAFSPTDGFLYIGMGDGGSGCDPFNNAQSLGTLLGKMLRIDVESPVTPPAVRPYNIPASNPLLNGTQSEIWALGLRNPFRFSFDRVTGDLYIGDVGQNAFEEINFQAAASTGGENYGWNVMEGLHFSNESSGCTPQCLQTQTCSALGLILPVVEYDRTQGVSVTGGFVYRGSLHPRLQGVYFYADFSSGRIWGLQNAGTAPLNTLILDTTFNISSFGEDEAGEIYLTDYATGDIYKVSTFGDVPEGHFAFSQIESVFSSGVTAGCSASPLRFCPDSPITRGEMAVFIEASLGNSTSACIGQFGDVPLTDPFCGFIERLATDGITGGCGGGNFCPDAPITRAEMAVFVEAAIGNPANVCAGSAFTDVTATTVGETFCGFIERLGTDGITGGCGNGNFCPNNPVTRAQMAVFLVAAPLPLTP